jgi:hypothetical protein
VISKECKGCAHMMLILLAKGHFLAEACVKCSRYWQRMKDQADGNLKNPEVVDRYVEAR